MPMLPAGSYCSGTSTIQHDEVKYFYFVPKPNNRRSVVLGENTTKYMCVYTQLLLGA
eukprot:SAG31_NODE_29453_length_395_cov_0.736486_1_plen_56_part_10